MIYRLQEHEAIRLHPTLLKHPALIESWNCTETVLPNKLENYSIDKTASGFDRVIGPEGVVYLGAGPVSVVISPSPS